MSMASLLPSGENVSAGAAACGGAGERVGGVGESSITTVSMWGGGFFAPEEARVRATFGVEAVFFGGALVPDLGGGGLVGSTKVGSLKIGFQKSSLNVAKSSSLDGCWSEGVFGAKGLFDCMPPLVGAVARVGDDRALLDRLPVEATVLEGPGSKVLASNFPFQACWENLVLMVSDVLLKDFSNWSFRLFETLKLRRMSVHVKVGKPISQLIQQFSTKT
jgi:hypothetical protein